MHPILEEGVTLSSLSLAPYVTEIAQLAGLPGHPREHSVYGEGGPAAYQMGYETPDGDEVYVFDLAGMSLEDTADRFLRWAAIPEETKVIGYAAPSFTDGFMEDLRSRCPAAQVCFVHIPDDAATLQPFTDCMAAPSQPKDADLEQALMRQERAGRSRNLSEARLLVEGLVAKTLERDMSPPEARVEAVRACAYLEGFAREVGRLDAMRAMESGES